MTDTLSINPRWTDLASPRLGSDVIFASDDFFADKARLIDPDDPVFIPGKYDDNGKWMDGWETRRRRAAGHDLCIIRLGHKGIVKAFEIDTRHFTGNFPPAASIDLCVRESGDPDANTLWREAVPITALKGNDRLLVTLPDAMEASHIRLNIYPDGGVARLRVYGHVAFDPQSLTAGETIDLLALAHGGRAIAANDAHFGKPDNLIAPGRGINMGDGWETRRRREPGHDWAILALGCPGIVDEVLIDTAHFKGNFPDRFSLQAAYCPDSPDELAIVQSQFWPVLLEEQTLKADAELHIRDGLAALGPISHVRLNIIPDGGVSRLRLFGKPAQGQTKG
ncbi:putative allantoicase 1 [Iodidimonas gelatinilytica]|uniref:Probable allantoicase n=1 Tax=Iodidimonas gelatinilytica TaxID=1236966 RepID=A0A5A7MTV4_9PROT|nr:allantoicase [Iodidimonas gelatinilytica]GEQ98415.1 putative allantoicase 1 [Iodidimonas gelatinilytica]